MSNYVGKFTKAGSYRIVFSGNTADTNINVGFWSSSVETSGYTVFMQASSENGAAPATWCIN
jgi:hypothetical protein